MKKKHSAIYTVFQVGFLIYFASIFILWQRLHFSQSSESLNPTRPPGPRSGTRNICLFSSDFWGLNNSGGTATAFELLARTLAREPENRVTFIGVTDDCSVRERFEAFNDDASPLERELLCSEGLPIYQSYAYESQGIAIVDWLLSKHQDGEGACDIIHGHEWGGAMAPTVTLNRLGGFYHRPLMIVIQLHGGNTWSSHYRSLETPFAMNELRIDAHEKIATEMADVVVSPTRHMASWYSARGWQMGSKIEIIQNVLSNIDTSSSKASSVSKKPVYRLGFFGRLETRKGLKVFVDMIESLPDRLILKDAFDVTFIGASATVDDMQSEKWIASRLGSWKGKYKVITDASRQEALDLLKREEGILLVFCSFVENAPYVVAEAAATGTPFLTFDVGGTDEVVQLTAENVLPMTRASDMVSSIVDAVVRLLDKGEAETSQMLPNVGAQQWMAWHKSMIVPQYKTQPCAGIDLPKVYVVDSDFPFMKLFNEICDNGDEDDIVLLKPPHYYFDRSRWQHTCTTRLKDALSRYAVTFGIKDGSMGVYPSSPAWNVMFYNHSMDTSAWKCNLDFPVLLTRRLLCSLNIPSRVFSHFSPWAVAFLLKKRGNDLLVHPDILFEATNWTRTGGGMCRDSADVILKSSEAQLAFRSLQTDAQFILLDQTLPRKHFEEAIADIKSGNDWKFGYGPSSTQITFFTNSTMDGEHGATWQCKDNSYPFARRDLLHPCAEESKVCCGEESAPVHAVYSPTTRIVGRSLVMRLAFLVCPSCGDGVDITVELLSCSQSSTPAVLYGKGVSPRSECAMEQIEVKLALKTGDSVVMSVFPRGSQDCDSVYIRNWEFIHRE